MTTFATAAVAVKLEGLPSATSQLSAAVEKAGQEGGKGAGDEISGQLEKSSSDAGSKFASGFGAKLKTGLKVAGGLAVAGLGVALAGVNKAIDQSGMQAKLSAQLGLSGKDSARYGKIAGQLYANNYGESLDDVNDALVSVTQNVGKAATGSNKSLSSITGTVLNLSETFDQDLGGTTAAVGQLLRTGLAKNAQQALDIITVGFQKGANKADDFLDTLNEYGTQFRKLGIDGQTATGLLTQGLQGGARDADLVADAIKEFSIRAVDGSTTTAQGFKLIGVNAKDMAEQIGKGGPAARKGLDTVLDRLRAIKDPVKQSQAAVALFGTQAEDLGKALYSLNPETAVQGLGKVGGAADRLNKTLGDTAGSRIESFKRGLQTTFVSVLGNQVIPIVQQGAGYLGTIGSKIQGLVHDTGPLKTIFGQITPLLSKFGGVVAAGAGIFAAYSAGIKVWAIATKGASIAAGAFRAVMAGVNLVMAANPFVLIVAGLAALGVALVVAYKKSETFRNIVQGAFHAVAVAAGAVVSVFTQTIPHAASAMVNGIKTGFNAALNFVKQWGPLVLTAIFPVLGIPVLIATHWKQTKNLVSKALSSTLSWLSGLGGRMVDAIGDIASKLTGKGTRFIGGLFKGIRAGWADVAGWLGKLGGTAVDRVGDIASKLTGKGARFIGGFLSGVRSAAGDVWAFFRKLPFTILNTVGDVASRLTPKGGSILRGFLSGIRSVAGDVWAFFRKLPGTAVDSVGDVASRLVYKGGSLLRGFLHGVTDVAGDVWSWFRDLPGKITSALPDLGSVLYGAGTNLIAGFGRGIVSKFGDIKNKLGDLTGKLTSWKGPPATDAKILTGNGRLVMQGFMAGIDQQLPALQRQLSGITTALPNTIGGGPVGRVAPSSPAPVSSAGVIDYDRLAAAVLAGMRGASLSFDPRGVARIVFEQQKTNQRLGIR